MLPIFGVTSRSQYVSITPPLCRLLPLRCHFAFTHVSHRAIAPSRRDDLEALGFVFLFFLNGKLPWDDIKARDKRTRNDMMLRLKHETTVPELCEGAPPQAATALCKHLAHCRQLKFDQEPGSAPCSDALW